MRPPRQHSLMPCLNASGYHITGHPGSHGSWDLRVDARNGDAITVEDISVSEAQAFIKCLEKMLIHQAPDPLSGQATSIDEARAAEGLDERRDPPPPADDPPSDPSDQPRTDPPSTGPEPAAAQEPLATGGWIPPGAQSAVIGAGDYVLPQSWINPRPGPWQEIRFDPAVQLAEGRHYQLSFNVPTPGSTRHMAPQLVHVKPGEVISLVCSCQPIAGGTLADDPNCRMHHAVPTVYVFDGS